MSGSAMYELVRVGHQKLVGKDTTTTTIIIVIIIIIIIIIL